MDFDIFSAILQPIIVCDESGHIVYANDACALSFGYDEHQLRRKIFPDFLKLKPEFPWSFKEITERTLYREASFETGRQNGAVQYAVKPLQMKNGETRWMICFRDATMEINLQKKYSSERRTAENLSQEVLGQRAELLISQQNLERMVAQMSFLLSFYSRTRFVLEPHLIAFEFMQIACEEIGFQEGLYFHFEEPGRTLRFESHVSLMGEAQKPDRALRTKIRPEDNDYLFSLMSESLCTVEVESASPTAGAFYAQFGVENFTNAAVLTLRDGERLIGQIHLTNFLQSSEVDQSTIDLFKYMIDPLELTLRNTELYRASVTDELTQLSNVRYFRIKLQGELEKAEKTEKPVSLIMIDLDHFKKINDTYGHPIGDQVIRSAAALLKSSVRATDIPARYGGEEMAIILPNCSVENAVIVAEKIRSGLEALEIPTEKGILRFTASLGVASFPVHANSREDLVEKADQALYKAKHSGRNRVVSN